MIDKLLKAANEKKSIEITLDDAAELYEEYRLAVTAQKSFDNMDVMHFQAANQSYAIVTNSLGSALLIAQ
jgi:hypothetical protein